MTSCLVGYPEPTCRQAGGEKLHPTGGFFPEKVLKGFS